MKEPVWIDAVDLHAFHLEMLSMFGGLAGVCDEGLLDSALGRPRHLYAYGTSTLFELAAEYAVGIIKNHPFLDGNKRAGFMAAALFLEVNGLHFGASEEQVVLHTLGLAASGISGAEYASWLESVCSPVE
ncbi:MAG: type II toxin-antitoxin system death-on-curing family toxin [Pontiella sp.]